MIKYLCDDDKNLSTLGLEWWGEKSKGKETHNTKHPAEGALSLNLCLTVETSCPATAPRLLSDEAERTHLPWPEAAAHGAAWAAASANHVLKPTRGGADALRRRLLLLQTQQRQWAEWLQSRRPAEDWTSVCVCVYTDYKQPAAADVPAWLRCEKNLCLAQTQQQWTKILLLLPLTESRAIQYMHRILDQVIQ